MKYVKTALGIIIGILILVPFISVQNTVSAYMPIPAKSCDPIIVTDGDDGAYLVFRGSQGTNGYVQRLDDSGQFAWAEPYTFSTVDYVIEETFWAAPDENGKLILVWAGYQNDIFGLFAQKIDREANHFWTENGLFITGLSRESLYIPDIKVIADQDGGAIVVWQQPDYPRQIHAQKILPDGTKQWGVLGKRVSSLSGHLFPQCCFSDGKGGAIITWEGDWEVEEGIFAQKITQDGQTTWAEQGVKVCDDAYYWNTFGYYDRSILSVITYREKTGVTIAQLTDEGYLIEHTSGKIYPSRKNLEITAVIPAGYEGFYIIWNEEYSGLNFYRNDCDLYAQKFTAKGEPVWRKPLVIINTPDEQNSPVACSDAAGGCIVAWKNYSETESKLLIQRFDEKGKLVWGEEPLYVDNVYSPVRDYVMIPNGSGGAILVREEGAPESPAIFSQVIYADMTWTSPDRYLYPNRSRPLRNQEPLHWPSSVNGRPNSFMELIVIFLAIPAGCFVLIFLYNRVKKYLLKRR